MIRVLLVDDQQLIRAGLRMLCAAEPDIEVVGEAGDGREAVTLAERLAPDVVVMDLRMPGVDGITATGRILAARPATRVLVLTTFGDDDHLYPALTAGACGFLLKDSGPTLLAEAVRAAAVGDSLVSPSVTVRLLKHVTAETERAAGAEAPRAREPLTDRELDVVRLVALGHTNAEIAASMFVSLSTVKTHLGSIQLKLAARNRVEIAAWAWRTGLAGDRS